MDIHELQVEVNRWQQRSDLMAEQQLLARAAALDFLRFAEEMIQMQGPLTPEAQQVRAAAASFAATLTTVNQALFTRIRSGMQAGTLRDAALRTYLNQFTSYGTAVCDGVYTSYDGLDVLLDGLFALPEAPAPIRTLDAEMVHCEETPARAILDLIDHVGWQPQDIFYDLGSGLGQVVMLVHLLTGIEARGVEVEPAFVAFAAAQAHALNLAPVTFLNIDARAADYRDGTIFFLFTPFRGEILRTVLSRLQLVAQTHLIRVCTFGFCTPRVAEQPWLHPLYGDPQHEYRLVIFESQCH